MQIKTEVSLMSVQKLNQNNFNNAIANGTALVVFYADWCGKEKTRIVGARPKAAILAELV